MPEVCVNTLACAEHLLSFWSLEFHYVLGRGYLCDQPPINTLNAESLRASLVDGISHILSQSVAGRIKNVFLIECTGEDSQKVELAPSVLSICHFILHPLAVIKHGYSYMPSSMSPSKSPKPGGGLEGP